MFAIILAIVTATAPAQAQMLLTTQVFRVIEVDLEQNRFGVAKLSANPTVRQNWVYIKINTKGMKRFVQDGWQKDEEIDSDDICESLEVGSIVKVSGGRGWDGTITAKSVVILPEEPEETDN